MAYDIWVPETWTVLFFFFLLIFFLYDDALASAYTSAVKTTCNSLACIISVANALRTTLNHHHHLRIALQHRHDRLLLSSFMSTTKMDANIFFSFALHRLMLWNWPRHNTATVDIFRIKLYIVTMKPNEEMVYKQRACISQLSCSYANAKWHVEFYIVNTERKKPRRRHVCDCSIYFIKENTRDCRKYLLSLLLCVWCSCWNMEWCADGFSCGLYASNAVL